MFEFRERGWTLYLGQIYKPDLQSCAKVKGQQMFSDFSLFDQILWYGQYLYQVGANIVIHDHC